MGADAGGNAIAPEWSWKKVSRLQGFKVEKMDVTDVVDAVDAIDTQNPAAHSLATIHLSNLENPQLCNLELCDFETLQLRNLATLKL
jgi:hypothetical protein